MKSTSERTVRSPQSASCCSVSWFDQFNAAPSASSERGVSQSAGRVESPDYEWTSPVNLPGLIVPPNDRSGQKTTRRRTSAQVANELFCSEDGDSLHPCQLPGRLPTQNSAPIAPARWKPSEDASRDTDEYSERAAMQLPGRLKKQS